MSSKQNSSATTILLPVNKLVLKESAAVRTRVSALPEKTNPVLVKPLQNGLYYVLNGTNRVYRAQSQGTKEIECLIATPDFSRQIEQIVQSRVSGHALALAESDLDRHHLFYLDTDRYSQRVATNSNRGTVIRLVIEIEFDDKTIHSHFCVPLQSGLGGLVFDPIEFNRNINTKFVRAQQLLDCWGDDTKYDARVLPSFLELSEDGSDVMAGGYLLRQASRTEKYEDVDKLALKSRGKVKSVTPCVLYPNGLVWEGRIDYKPDETFAIVWSEHLLDALNDPTARTGFSPDIHWWKNPTSIVLNKDRKEQWCTPIVHTCGPTCEGID